MYNSILLIISHINAADINTSRQVFLYLIFAGCFTREATQPTILLKEASVLECQISCDDYPCFAITVHNYRQK